MKALTLAGIAAGLLVLASARLGAQEHADKPAAKPAAPAKVAAPARTEPARPPRGPVIAPSKPVVAPGIAPKGDAGALPTAARSANARTISVSASQAAAQTVAALVAAMKNIPKRPPAPPESRTPRARRAAAEAQAKAFDAPPPIVYRVTWPAAPPELGLDRRVELEWRGESAGAARLRWNQPAPE
jgi:23S rRNA pseudouridine2605 synthase